MTSDYQRHHIWRILKRHGGLAVFFKRQIILDVWNQNTIFDVFFLKVTFFVSIRNAV